MNSLLRGAVGEDVRYELKTSIACTRVSEGLRRHEDAYLGFEKIIVGRAHVIYQQLPSTFIFLWEFYRVFDEFGDRLSLSAGCL